MHSLGYVLKSGGSMVDGIEGRYVGKKGLGMRAGGRVGD